MMGRRLRKSIVRRRCKKVGNVLTTLKRHCGSDCMVEGVGFVGTCEDEAGAVYFVWKARILICGCIERVRASIVRGSRVVRSSRSHACILHHGRVLHVKDRSDTEARVA